MALAACIAATPSLGEPASRQASVSQSVKFRVVIPELPPLAIKGGAKDRFALAGKGRLTSVVRDGGQRTAHIVDRHGRLYTKQVHEGGEAVTTMLAAP